MYDEKNEEPKINAEEEKLRRASYAKFFKETWEEEGRWLVSYESEGAPKELDNFVLSLHLNWLKSENLSWIYEIILRAIENLSLKKLEDCVITTDSSSYGLSYWFNENIEFAGDFCNKAIEYIKESYPGRDLDIFWILGQAQYMAITEIYNEVYQWLNGKR